MRPHTIEEMTPSFYRLPVEIICEIMGHLDLDSLIMFLQAYKELQCLVALFTDFEPSELEFETDALSERIKQHTIREVLPQLAVHSWTALDKGTKTAPIRIVELLLTMEPLEPRFNRGRPGALREWMIWERLESICANLDRHCFVRLVDAPGADIRHIRLSRACESVGAVFESSYVPCLDFPTKIKTTPSEWGLLSGLKSIHIHGQHSVSITCLPRALCVFVELEHRVRRRALLTIDEAPMLRRLTVHYKGHRVPDIGIGSNVFSRHYKKKRSLWRFCNWSERHFDSLKSYDCSLCQDHRAAGNMFELVRVGGRTEESALRVDNGMNYEGNFEFLRRCCCLVLDGIPDWVILDINRFHRISFTGLVWKCWAGCGSTVNINDGDALKAFEKLRVLLFFTNMEGYTLPSSIGRSLYYLVICTTAYGFNPNEILIGPYPQYAMYLNSVTVACPPYHHSMDPMVFNDDLQLTLSGIRSLYTEGHIVLELLTAFEGFDSHFGGLKGLRFDMSTLIARDEEAGLGPFPLLGLMSADPSMIVKPWEYLNLVAPSAPRIPPDRSLTPARSHYTLELSRNPFEDLRLQRKAVVDNRVKLTINGIYLTAPGDNLAGQGTALTLVL